MSRAVVVIRSNADREKIARWASQAPLATRVEFKAEQRTIPQNSRLWAMLTDVATQVTWRKVDGTPMKLRPEDWKTVFLHALNRETCLVEAIDGHGIVNIGRSSSDLSKDEFSDLIEVIRMFGAAHGVTFADEQEAA